MSRVGAGVGGQVVVVQVMVPGGLLSYGGQVADPGGCPSLL